MDRPKLLQKLVDNGRCHPEGFEPIPVGQIALELGIWSRRKAAERRAKAKETK